MVEEFYRLYITERDLLVSGERRLLDDRILRTSSFSVEPLSADAVYLIKRGNENRVRRFFQLGFDYRMPDRISFRVPGLLFSDQLLFKFHPYPTRFRSRNHQSR